MKCPLLMPRWIGMPEVIKDSQVECIKEECAWWQEEIGNCIIYQLGMEIGTLTSFLEDIRDKMPHEGQFRDR